MKSAHGAFIPPVEGPPGAPQWRRVHAAVRHAIDSGALGPGARLPSARQLAADWQVARGAVDEAFAQLQLEGLIERRVGDGTYVGAGARPARRRTPAPAAVRALQKSQLLGLPAARLESAQRGLPLPPLHPRCTDLEAFPFDTWRRLLLQAHDDAQRPLMAAPPAGGLPALREAIARHLAVHRGTAFAPARVLVTAGPGESLQLAARLLLAPGDTACVEDPGHASIAFLLRTLGVQVVGVPLDGEGFDVEAARRLAPQAKLVYLHPLTQYPLGQRTRTDRCSALLDWAARQGPWILEGHMNDELVPAAQQPPALVSNDASGRVLMMGTFEGVAFPSLRVGYLVVPKALAPRMAAAAALLGEHVPAPVQWALAEFIDRGHMTAHLQALRATLFRRREIVRRELLAALPPAVRPGPMNNGTHLALHLPPALPDRSVVARLRTQRVVVEALSAIRWQAPRANGIVLGYAGSDEARLVEGLRAVARALAEACGAYQPTGENA